MDEMTIEQMLERARAGLDRVTVDTLDDELAAGALLVDTRPEAIRRAEGEFPEAVVVERNEVEWRFCPTSEHRLDGITADSRVILVCNDSYASSLAAATLRLLGLRRATDLVGGYRAWKRTVEG